MSYSSDGGGGSSDDDFSDARSDCWSDSEGDHSAREDVGTDEEDEDPLHCLLPPLHPDIFFHSTVPFQRRSLAGRRRRGAPCGPSR